MFVLDCLATSETRQRLHPQLNQERGCIISSERKFEEGRGLAAWSDDSRQYPKLGILP
jgi:hypothetical protein